jgi:hypothetical protein
MSTIQLPDGLGQRKMMLQLAITRTMSLVGESINETDPTVILGEICLAFLADRDIPLVETPRSRILQNEAKYMDSDFIEEDAHVSEVSAQGQPEPVSQPAYSNGHNKGPSAFLRDLGGAIR